jgi:uncharacterized membrane protein
MQKENRTKQELINIILEDNSARAEEEETLHLLLKEKLSKNIDAGSDNNLSLGGRMADSIAKRAGSWTFIIIFITFLFIWILMNILMAKNAFDVYPFILLNLMLSCVAAIQAPVIMMSQNRQEEKDRLRAQNDYKINLKSEIIIEDLHQKLDLLIENQNRILEKINKLEKAEASQSKKE